ncbi:MAG: type II toxin-antitoxin system Phd/YefM family antitoxin [Anaerolineales bacterium]|nr:type II toxin-antitoxin system Phd/YefM family antitoxin [Anaerolineales bacterium]
MNTITAHQAAETFPDLLQQVLQNLEPTIVMMEDGQSVVMLPLDEYNAWQETLHLLSTPANAVHLQKSIAEDQAGYYIQRELLDE